MSLAPFHVRSSNPIHQLFLSIDIDYCEFMWIHIYSHFSIMLLACWHKKKLFNHHLCLQWLFFCSILFYLWSCMFYMHAVHLVSLGFVAWTALKLNKSVIIWVIDLHVAQNVFFSSAESWSGRCFAECCLRATFQRVLFIVLDETT